MNDIFYFPIFRKTYNGLRENGYYIINVCNEVYDKVLLPLLGPPFEMYPLKKSKRQNDYKERLIYVWKKGYVPIEILI